MKNKINRYYVARKYFIPITRGNLYQSLVEKNFEIVAPQSPRPAQLLDNVKITSGDILTANDIALHELLLSFAYESDTKLRTAKKPLPEAYTMPANLALHYMGPSSRRDALSASLRRLTATTMTFGTKADRFENVPLLATGSDFERKDDVITFSFPKPIRDIMQTKQRYAYLELVPLAHMKSRYSIRLYKKLALEASRQKWSAKGDNGIILSAKPAEIAQWAGFQPENGIVSVSKLRDRVLKFIATDFAALRAFSVSFREVYGTGRGCPVEYFEFRLNLKAPIHRLVCAQFKPGEHKEKGIGGVDTPEYRVDSYIWQKAQSKFGKAIGDTFTSHYYFFQAWLLALEEAITKDAWSPAYNCRSYRGPRLLTAIEKWGASEAAWQFCCEEAASPDFLTDQFFLIDQAERLKTSRNERISAIRNKSQILQREASPKLSAIEEIGDIDLSESDAAMIRKLFSVQ